MQVSLTKSLNSHTHFCPPSYSLSYVICLGVAIYQDVVSIWYSRQLVSGIVGSRYLVQQVVGIWYSRYLVQQVVGYLVSRQQVSGIVGSGYLVQQVSGIVGSRYLVQQVVGIWYSRQQVSGIVGIWYSRQQVICQDVIGSRLPVLSLNHLSYVICLSNSFLLVTYIPFPFLFPAVFYFSCVTFFVFKRHLPTPKVS